MKGNLYLIPTEIAENTIDWAIPTGVRQIVHSIRCFIVENERTARRQLLKMGITAPIDSLSFSVLDKHTDKTQLNNYLDPCLTEHVGLLSEAGVPAVADPGSEIVAIAHQKGIKVVPLVGPSSIILALMASGMNGQSFAFHGYLPVKPPERIRRIKELELLAGRTKQTQIFIEAPYRNNQLLQDLVNTCNGTTSICVACNLNSPEEFVLTQPVSRWKSKMPDLHKKPALFLLQ
jgi:16S rRNA (cytidine1402-2'-O)-methyltransferase